MGDWGRKPTDFQKKGSDLFLGLLLVPFLAGRPRFCLVVLVGLTVGLAIGGAESTRGEIAVGLVGFF